LIIVGILIAVGIVYLYMLYSTSRRNKALNQPTEVATATVPSAANAPAQQLPATPSQPGVSNLSDEALQRSAAQNQANQQSIADLQNQMQQLQNQLNTVTNSISTLGNQLQVIANEIKAIAIDRSLKGQNTGLAVSGIAYRLKALIPGRAWLQSRNGTTTSVTLGDRLPGYGIIQMINTEQGIVTTSSGAIIQYGPKDS
jgi:intracellular multiplication protein IcmG